MTVIHQWRTTHMYKRAGRGHEEDGIATTPPGGLAVLCPVSPHVGKNVSDSELKTLPL